MSTNPIKFHQKQSNASFAEVFLSSAFLCLSFMLVLPMAVEVPFSRSFLPSFIKLPNAIISAQTPFSTSAKTPIENSQKANKVN
jgi:hypothetical protein